ncbi:penicillin-binding protein 1C [Marinilabiliaceae bacterium N1Y90]|nr:penicillin-binding protein 1C [Marinilabiliaceae bacterium N1Y90]
MLAFYFSLPTKLFAPNYSAVLYSNNGNLLGAHIANDGQWRFPQIDSVPHKFEQAIIHFEDEYFYYHPGFNPISILRALKQNISAGKVKSGGSTITMQVIRLARNKKRNLFNKLIETIQATRLELRYSKKEILQLYAAHAPFGGNVVGIEAAAWRYFGRPSHQLSWSESTLLAVLPNAPSLIHPGKNRERLLQKRDRLLGKLLTKNIIDSTEYYLACAEPLPEKPLPLPMSAPHLLDKLMKKNGNLAFKSTLDKELQIKTNQVIDNFYKVYQHNEIHNLAAIIIDNESNNILAYTGNAISSSGNYGHKVDIITSNRSTGSILKPFLYAAALENGILLPKMLVADIPTYYSDFAPKNYTLQFDGAVPAHTALSRSLNVPAVRLLQEYRVERFYNLLKKLNISSFNKAPSHYGLSLILGGGEANLLELSSAYSSLARSLSNYTLSNSRYKSTDISIAQHLKRDKKETVIYTDNPPALSAGSIYYTMEALTNVQRPDEETGWENFSSGRKIAWKTGTSFGNRDAWSIGVTPKYTVGVWVGNASGEGRPGIIGGSAAAPVMFELFRNLPSTAWFETPYDDLEPILVCRESGHKASNICLNTDTVYVPLSNNDMPVCPYHQIIHLDKEHRYQVNANCYPINLIVHESRMVLPPLMAWYYQSKNPAYKPLPPFKEGCSGWLQSPLELIYPKENAELLVPREIDGSLGRIVCKASHQNRKEKLFWHLDDYYLGQTQYIHQMEIVPQEGAHILNITDESGNMVHRSFSVPSKTPH